MVDGIEKETFCVEPEKRLLALGPDPIRLSNRPFQVLLHLIENRERLVPRRELLDKFWAGRDVYDEALTKAVGAIRKALNEPHDHPRFIETRWAEGYRFIGVPLAENGSQNGRRLTFVPSASNGNGTAKPVTIADSGVPVHSPKPVLLIVVAAALLLTVSLAAFLYLTNSSPLAPSEIDSVAVLPFRNPAANPSAELFADGLTENLIGALAKVDGLKVIARGSAGTLRDIDSSEAARRLGVASVVDGSVREDQNQVRVTVRLIRAADGEVIWSETYDRTASDLFEIQDEVARSVATKLRLKLSPASEKEITKRHTGNLEAYQAYLKGRHFWRMKNKESLERSRKFFEEAIALDPKYAMAYAGLADYYFSGIWYAGLPYDDAIAQGKVAVAKVLELDPQLAEAHNGLARIATFEWDWPTAIREKEKALELDPNNASLWQGYAFLMERGDAALDAIRRAQELDPLSPNINTDVGVILRRNGRLAEAVEALKKTLDLDPNYADAYYNLGVTHEMQGSSVEAFEAYVQAERISGLSDDTLAAYQHLFSRDGIKGYWRHYLKRIYENDPAAAKSVFWTGAIHAHLGEKEQAFKLLEAAHAARDPLIPSLRTDHRLDSLKDDDRFAQLVARLGPRP